MQRWPALSRRGHQALRRAPRAIVLVLAATWALYLVVVHVLLWTPLLRHEVNKTPEAVMLAYEYAWSIWPGRVHVHGLRLRIRDFSADALISVEHADASFDLPAFLGKQVVIRDVKASGVSVEVRMRYGLGQIAEDTLEGQPEIPGLPDPRRDQEHRRHITDEEYNLWTADLQHVVADVREVWIGPYRYVGDAHVEGSFYLRPARKLAIGPAHVDVRGGDLVLAKRPLGQAIKGTIDCTVPMTKLSGATAEELARQFSVDLKLESSIEDFAFLHRYLAHETHLRLDGGPGYAKGHLRVEQGKLLDESTFELQAKQLLAHHPRAGGATDLHASMKVAKGELTASVLLTDAKAMLRYAENWPIRVPTLSIAARSKSLDLTHGPLDDTVVSLDLPAANVTDVRVLRLFEQDFQLAKGTAAIRAHVDFDSKANLLAAEASVSSPRIEGTFQDISITTAFAASAKMPKLDLTTMKGSVPGIRLDLKDVEVRAKGGTDPPPQWWAWIEARELVFDEDHVIAELAAKMRDARPIVYVLGAKGELPKWTSGLLVMDGLTANAHFETGPGRIEIDRFSAQGGAWKSSGHFKKLDGKQTGELYLGNGTLGVKVPLEGGGSPSPAIGGGPKQSQ